MKRKRYIKLLMSHGETPKSARTKAQFCNISKTPYEIAYRNYLATISLKRIVSRAVSLFKMFNDSIMRTALSLNMFASANNMFASANGDKEKQDGTLS